MKIFFLLIFLFTSLIARENPFEATFKTAKVSINTIPLLHITSNKVFEKPRIPTPTKPIKIVTKPLIAPVHKHLLPPIMIIDEPVPVQVIEEKPTKRKAQKHSKKRRSYKTIYQNYFLKLQTNNRSFKIITQDRLQNKTTFTRPNRVAFDFKRLQYFHTKSITLKNPYATKIKLGTHHDFYRITLEARHNKHYKLRKKSYGYLLSFY